MRGRRPLPAVVHRARGNPGKRKIIDIPMPEASIECPARLEGDARAFWIENAQNLSEVGLLTAADTLQFEQLARAWAKICECEKEIAANGSNLVHTYTEFGEEKIRLHPSVTRLDKAELAFSNLLSKFGLDPSSRGRVKIQPPKQKSPLSALLDRVQEKKTPI